MEVTVAYFPIDLLLSMKASRKAIEKVTNTMYVPIQNLLILFKHGK